VARQYSVAEARARLPQLLDDVERGTSIQLTRRGKPVAFLVPVGEYQRLQFGKPDLWETIVDWRASTDMSDLDIDQIMQDVREGSPGRDVGI